MSWTSIPHAHNYWRRQRGQINPFVNLEEVEAFILSEPPTSPEDAACILEVVCANAGDVRCDGLDLAALGRLRTFLSPAL